MLAKPQLAVIGRVSTLVQDLGNGIMVAVGTAKVSLIPLEVLLQA